MEFAAIPYERPALEEIQIRVRSFIQRAEAANDGESLVAVLKEADRYWRHLRSLLAIVHIRFSQNVQSEFWRAERIYWEKVTPDYAEEVRRFLRIVVRHPARAQAEKLIGARYFTLGEVALKTFDPYVKPLLLKIAALEREYMQLTGSMLVEFQGKKYTVSQMGRFLQDSDRMVRRSALEAVWSQYDAVNRELDTLFDQLVHLRHQLATLLGFPDFISFRYLELERLDYTPQDVARFRTVVADVVVPLAERLKHIQQQQIGVDQLYVYDEPLLFPDGNPQPKGDPEWIIQQAMQMYDDMSSETGALIHQLIDGGYLDVLSRPGKAPGGFCAYIPDVEMPFIFANFNGTIDDVRVLTHEFGHAFQQYQSRVQPFLEYMSPTLELAEIHSMGMEFFAYPWMDRFFHEDVEKFRIQHLFHALTFLCYAAAVDEFQHEIYSNPNLTPQQRLQVWQKLEHKYLPWRNNDEIDPLVQGRYWQRQLHIYRAPLYYIDYALAQMCAFQFLLDLQKDFSHAFQRYVQLCRIGGSTSFLDALRHVSLESPFRPEVARSIISRICQVFEQYSGWKIQ